MTPLPLKKVTISGYFSRIFQRRSGPVRELALKVHRGQEESFKDLHTVYKDFDQSTNPDQSRALAKEIVKVAIQEVGPRGNLAKKIEQVTAATLSNWVRDRKRNALLSDIDAEMQQYIHRQEGVSQAGMSDQKALKEPFPQKCTRFVSFLYHSTWNLAHFCIAGTFIFGVALLVRASMNSTSGHLKREARAIEAMITETTSVDL